MSRTFARRSPDSSPRPFGRRRYRRGRGKPQAGWRLGELWKFGVFLFVELRSVTFPLFALLLFGIWMLVR